MVPVADDVACTDHGVTCPGVRTTIRAAPVIVCTAAVLPAAPLEAPSAPALIIVGAVAPIAGQAAAGILLAIAAAAAGTGGGPPPAAAARAAAAAV